MLLAKLRNREMYVHSVDRKFNNNVANYKVCCCFNLVPDYCSFLLSEC